MIDQFLHLLITENLFQSWISLLTLKKYKTNQNQYQYKYISQKKEKAFLENIISSSGKRDTVN